MTFMEGVGDEVLVCATVVVVLLIVLFICSVREATSSQRPSSVLNGDLRPTPERVPVVQNHIEEAASSSIPSDLPEDPRPEPDTRPAEETQNNQQVPTETSTLETELTNGVAGIRQRRLDFFKKPGGGECPQLSQNGASPLANGSASSVTTETQEEVDPDLIHIRLKYLDDTERTVQSSPDQLIKDFKRVHFAEDLSNNKFVRLINNGQVLQDTRSLRSYGLVDTSVVHVQVQSNQVNYQRPSDEAEGELDLGQFLWPMLGILLLCVWVMHFQYKEYFSTSATVALFGLSGLFLTVVWGQHGSRTSNVTAQ